jgi:Cd2+/Zn2+-exporting ATPase
MSIAIQHHRLRLGGLSCADCAEKLEARVRKLPGVHQALLNFSAARLDVEHANALPAVLREVEKEGLSATIEGEPQLSTSRLRIAGLDCPDCAAKVESSLRGREGIEAATLNFTAGTLTVRHRLEPEALLESLERAGYQVTLESEVDTAQTRVVGRFDHARWRLLTTVVSTVLLILGWILSYTALPVAVPRTLYVATIAIGGYWTIRRGLDSLRALSFDMNALMTIAVTGALLIGEWTEAASVAVLYSVSNLLEAYTLDKTRNAIRGLMEIAPREALVRRDGVERRLPVENVQVGDIVIVKPGEKIPVDGIVAHGTSAVNQAPITGESLPVEKGPEDEVYAGTLNTLGALDIMVTKPAQETALARIIHLVEEAQAQRAPSQTFVDRFAKVYTPAVLIFAVLLATVPPLVFGASWDEWIYRALALLVMACPCALVMATPVAVVSAIGNAARHGVLIKGGAFLERAGRITAMAFDKTGTLTLGRPAVVEIIPAPGHTGEETLALAAAVERRAAHPLAEAIVRAAQERGIVVPAAGEYQALPGLGVSAIVEEIPTYAGRQRLFADLGISTASLTAALGGMEVRGQTTVLVGTDAGVVGLLAIADEVRAISREAIHALHHEGIVHTVMLTGDSPATAQTLAAQVGVDDFQAHLMPDQKVEAVQALRARFGPVAMVGDGINDAPALAAADLGIAMGVAGSDIALETADIALMADDLTKLPYTIRLSRKALRIIKENIALALVLKGIAFLLVFPGWLTLWMAVLADMGASILVTLNGLRLINGAGKPVK